MFPGWPVRNSFIQSTSLSNHSPYFLFPLFSLPPSYSQFQESSLWLAQFGSRANSCSTHPTHHGKGMRTCRFWKCIIEGDCGTHKVGLWVGWLLWIRRHSKMCKKKNNSWLYGVYFVSDSLLRILHLITYLTLQQLYEKGAISIPIS